MLFENELSFTTVRFCVRSFTFLAVKFVRFLVRARSSFVQKFRVFCEHIVNEYSVPAWFSTGISTWYILLKFRRVKIITVLYD